MSHSHIHWQRTTTPRFPNDLPQTVTFFNCLKATNFKDIFPWVIISSPVWFISSTLLLNSPIYRVSFQPTARNPAHSSFVIIVQPPLPLSANTAHPITIVPSGRCSPLESNAFTLFLRVDAITHWFGIEARSIKKRQLHRT